MRPIMRMSLMGVCALAVVGGIWALPPAARADEGLKEKADLKEKVAALEQRVAKLEERLEELKSPRLYVNPRRPAPRLLPQLPAPESGKLPEGWVEKEFNGQRFYLVPCEQQPGSK